MCDFFLFWRVCWAGTSNFSGPDCVDGRVSGAKLKTGPGGTFDAVLGSTVGNCETGKEDTGIDVVEEPGTKEMGLDMRDVAAPDGCTLDAPPVEEGEL